MGYKFIPLVLELLNVVSKIGSGGVSLVWPSFVLFLLVKLPVELGYLGRGLYGCLDLRLARFALISCYFRNDHLGGALLLEIIQSSFAHRPLS